MTKRDLILAELRKIAKRHHGLLRVEHVIEEARDRGSPLHEQFTWDNKKAAHEYRLWQARELIGQYWTVEPASNEPIRMLLSLTNDRIGRTGYRFSADVLADPKRRGEWLAMALDDLQGWRRTYGSLTELRPVFVAIARVLAKYEKQKAAG